MGTIPVLKPREVAELLLALDEKMKAAGKKTYAPLKLYGQELEPGTWAMANMNMIIHDNDFNISPSRYIHTGEADEYRPIAEIVEELEALEVEARETDAALKAILVRIGV